MENTDISRVLAYSGILKSIQFVEDQISFKKITAEGLLKEGEWLAVASVAEQISTLENILILLKDRGNRNA